MRFVLFAVVLAFVIGCSSTLTRKDLPTLESQSQEQIRSNLEFLASDLLEGRETTTRGNYIAGDFIATRLEQYGLKPYGDNGTYFQYFDMQEKELKKGSELILVSADNRADTMLVKKDFIPGGANDSLDSNQATEMVFVKYGITEPAYNYDDYAGLDVNGKIVVALSGEPDNPEDSTYFNGSKPTKWARSRAKRELAQQKGAAGFVLILYNRIIKIWDNLVGWLTGKNIGLPSENGNEIAYVYSDSSMAKKIFAKEGVKYNTLFTFLQNDSLAPGTILPERMKMDIGYNTKMVKGRNIVGILPGSDRSLSKQFVTVGAHYDHLGITDQGVVYNGADDNGSGTCAILESARVLGAAHINRRPIIYIFHDAEEKGLIGSDYFTNHIDYLDDIIVNINMDMVGRENVDSIYVIGSGKLSDEFYKIVEDANKKTGNFVFDYTLDDENHPERIYYRSDHWNYARKGIPIVFLTDWHKKDYHKPNDDVDKINFTKIQKVSSLTTEIAIDVANLDHKLKVDRGPRVDGQMPTTSR